MIGAAEHPPPDARPSGRDSADARCPQRRRPDLQDRARQEQPGGPRHLQSPLRLEVTLLAAVPQGRDGHRGRLQRRARARKLQATAGPFTLQTIDDKSGEVLLARNPRWWGRPAKLSEIAPVAVPRDQRAQALAADKVDLAEIDPEEAGRITLAARDKGTAPPQGPGSVLTPATALRSWAVAHGSDEKAAS